jgi:hypothetical protein
MPTDVDSFLCFIDGQDHFPLFLSFFVQRAPDNHDEISLLMIVVAVQ